jgi:hypothetical protein
MKTKYILGSIYLFLANCILAQQHDALAPLSSNAQQIASKNYNSKIQVDSLKLPFVEDFSKYYYSSIPDQTKFVDQYVYINNELALVPPSIGFATFDGLNEFGKPYVTNTNPNSSSSIVSDYLTSGPFKWGNNKPVPSDSIYLSFYYKAKGIGNEPDKKDSLILEYKNATTGAWKKIWSREGYTVSSSDTNFKLVMLPIKDTAFLKRGFQFRFKNKSNGTGALDHWHVDYIYINKGRFSNDVSPFIDVAYKSKAFQFFKKYRAMPFQQYLGAADLNKRFNNRYRNLRRGGTGSIRIDSFNFAIKGPINITSKNKFGCDIDTMDVACKEITSDTLIYNLPASIINTGRKCLELRHYIGVSSGTNPDFKNFKQNDTMYQKICFDDYFALDDGSAEKAYYLDVKNTGLVGRFDINKIDTLRAVDLFFLPVLNNGATTNNQIKIKVYAFDNNSGKPGNIIYEDVYVQPFFTSGYGQFIRFILGTKQVLPAGSYFIGFDQKSDSLQIGFDANTNNKDNFFYRIGTTWNNISFEGTPMIRPAFGDFSVGLNAVSIEKKDWKIYPNPSNNEFTIQHAYYSSIFNESYSYELLNMFGQTIAKESYRENNKSVDVKNFADGIYFLKIYNADNALQQSFKIQIKH